MNKFIFTFFILTSFSLFSDSAEWTGAGLDNLWQNNNNWTAPFPNANTDDATFPEFDAPLDILSNAFFGVRNIYMNNNDTVYIDLDGNQATIYEDVIFGASASGQSLDFTTPGVSYLFFGSASHLIDLSAADSEETSLIIGRRPYFFASPFTLNVIGPGLVEATEYFQSVSEPDTINLQGGVTLKIEELSGSPLGNLGTMTMDENSLLSLLSDVNTLRTIPTNMSGAGALLLDNTSINLTGTNTFSGGILLGENSVLRGTTTTIPSNSFVFGDVNTSLVFDQNTNGSFTNAITGDCSLTKEGTGNVTLTGSNTYTAGTTITAGTLTGNTSSFPAGRNIANSGTVAFNQSDAGTFSGVISETGAFNKLGNGNLTLSGTNTYSGATTVSAGTLTIAAAGAISTNSTTTVANGATLVGLGSAGPIVNNGTVQAGTEAGQAFSTTGNLTMDGNATTVVFVSPTQASQFDITGSAALDGTLNLQLSWSIRRRDLLHSFNCK